MQNDDDLLGVPAVFVHGNPESADIWSPLTAAFRPGTREIVRVSPPGFGAPVPDGFPLTLHGYRDWLIQQLEGFRTPVDLVGHDLGGMHVVNVVLNRPELVRSWVSDVVGIYDPDYAWHELARRWQTPGVGEVDVERRFGGTAEQRTANLIELGMGAEVASAVAAAQDATMGHAVLAVYRSAATELPTFVDQLELARARPGLTILAAEDDLVGTDAQRRRAASRAGARVEVLHGLSHWWMTQDPARGAHILERFWASVAEAESR